jgi:hypothetical protein
MSIKEIVEMGVGGERNIRHWEMFFVRQDRIVCVEVVLFEEFLSVSDLNVEEGISHAKEGI